MTRGEREAYAKRKAREAVDIVVRCEPTNRLQMLLLFEALVETAVRVALLPAPSDRGGA